LLSRTPKSSKLAELRQKTDRQLLVVIQNELERGLTLADLAASKDSALHARAEKACEKAAALLPKINGLTTNERRQLETKFKDLRAALDRVSSRNVQRHMASSG
jgi:hypothetical protein